LNNANRVTTLLPFTQDAPVADALRSSAVGVFRNSWRSGLPVSRKLMALLLLIFVVSGVNAQQHEILGPVGSGAFGTRVAVLPNGNLVVTDPTYSSGSASNVGAVYLYSRAGTMISMLTGSTAEDRVGDNGIVWLGDNKVVIRSRQWNRGPLMRAGALTWMDGQVGISGEVSAANSLLGSVANDLLGGANIVQLSNGNFVVHHASTDSGTAIVTESVTWGSRNMGVTGDISEANSIVWTYSTDYAVLYLTRIHALSNGNYVVANANWRNGSLEYAGAVTWGDGANGTAGAVTPANSLIGTTAGDRVGSTVKPLDSGDYIVISPQWDSATEADLGAISWGDGALGTSGAVTAQNSLIADTADDFLDADVTNLSNGNFVISSPSWDNGTIADAGAAMLVNGSADVLNPISPSNALVGTTAQDQVGKLVTRLSNGNYIVSSHHWGGGSPIPIGAVTWGNGVSGTTGAVSDGNSLVGSVDTTVLRARRITALSNGNYVVFGPLWDEGKQQVVGAYTWGNGAAGTSGQISAANSLVGTYTYNGTYSITPLTNGNYVVVTYLQSGFGLGAAWVNGSSSRTGTISTANSLYGGVGVPLTGGTGVTALSNGNYVVTSPGWTLWEPIYQQGVGAVTWVNGSTGLSGVVSAANSLVGSASSDSVGRNGVTALSDGNYVVASQEWDNGSIVDAGAITWGDGRTGIVATVSASNSLVGTTEYDRIGKWLQQNIPGAVDLRDGRYLVFSQDWSNGSIAGVGAITVGRNDIGVSGPITSSNSVIGESPGIGWTLSTAYSAVQSLLAVGQPIANKVTLFSIPVELPFFNGFE
jgi:Repeat of unknown function (DUF5650)